MVTEPIGALLVLRHASKRKSGTCGPDDYDVIQGGKPRNHRITTLKGRTPAGGAGVLEVS